MILPNKKIKILSDNLSNMKVIKGRSLWYDAKVRFFKNKAAFTSLIILLLVLFFSFIGPFFCTMVK